MAGPDAAAGLRARKEGGGDERQALSPRPQMSAAGDILAVAVADVDEEEEEDADDADDQERQSSSVKGSGKKRPCFVAADAAGLSSADRAATRWRERSERLPAAAGARDGGGDAEAAAAVERLGDGGGRRTPHAGRLSLLLLLLLLLTMAVCEANDDGKEDCGFEWCGGVGRGVWGAVSLERNEREQRRRERRRERGRERCAGARAHTRTHTQALVAHLAGLLGAVAALHRVLFYALKLTVARILNGIHEQSSRREFFWKAKRFVSCRALRPLS